MNKLEHVKIIVTNRKASFNYFLSDHLECGIELQGTEIKSIKQNKVNLGDAYVIIKNNEAFILNMDISEYEKGNIFNHDPLRLRKLLLHKKEIMKLNAKVMKDGYSIIPTKLYLKAGRCKVEIALGKGKKLYDKRDVIKERDVERHIAKSIKRD
ncbi:MAG TPA: SsrA-binding protein SmpB [Candidatus Onthovivens sp.]|nr:SsrA-binding protein SmpB [Candidatus Onthovivens sp.]